MDIKVGSKAIAEASEKLKNWGRWGKEDHSGTLNHVTPQDIVKAASLIRTGKVFALGIPLDANGPQNGLFGGRFNPIHQMLATGTDAVAERQDWNKIRYADDTLMLCVQGATHWDALGHVFYEDKAYNGHDA
ncbi:MAG TPA: cyclase family protein, partial [Xanthobacteraceae bacterium]